MKVEINTILKLKPEQGLDEENLKEGERYNFIKSDTRIYPLNFPIDLVNNNIEVIAKVKIEETTQTEKETKGKYKILKIYKGEEKEILTKNLKEFWER